MRCTLSYQASLLQPHLPETPIEPYWIDACNVVGVMLHYSGYIHKAIIFFQKAEIESREFGFSNLLLDALINKVLCEFDLWELEKALNSLFEYKLTSQKLIIREHLITSWFCLAFAYSNLGNPQKASSYIDKVCEDLRVEQLVSIPWFMGYRFLFMGLTYKNLDNFEKACEMYYKAIEYSKDSQYIQVQAKALCGLGEIHQKQGDLNLALSYHLESIEALDKIGAKPDLAEAYYQLGITYQAMDEIKKSSESFQEAIRIFSEMEAPKQVERVRQSMSRRNK